MFEVLFVIVILGVVLYFVERLPMEDNMKVLFKVLIILVIIYFLLSLIGVTTPPKLRL